MPGSVSSYQQGAFTAPVNGTAGDATQVLSNDNTLRAKYNSHDADATIHVQSSTLAARPAAGVVGRFWLTTDGLRLYYDNGVTWTEVAYVVSGGALTATTGAFSGAVSMQALTATTGAFSGGVTITGDLGTQYVTMTGFSIAGGFSSLGTVLTGDYGPDKIMYLRPGSATGCVGFMDNTGMLVARVTNGGTVVAAGVRTASGSTASVSGVPVALFNATTQGLYDVAIWVNGSGANYQCTARIIHDGTNLNRVEGTNGVSGAITLTPGVVNGTQSSGAGVNINWVYTLHPY